MTYHDYVSSPTLTHTPRAKRLPLRLLAILALACTVLAGCSPNFGGSGGAVGNGDDEESAVPQFDEGTTPRKFQDRGKLIVGTAFDVEGFSTRSSSTAAPEGFDIDVAKRIATSIVGSQIEGRIEWLDLDPRDRELALRQSKVDIVVGRYAVTPERKKLVDFAGPYLESHQVMVTLTPEDRSDTELRSLINFNGRKVCVVRGSTNMDALKSTVPQADVSNVQNTVADCASQLARGLVAGFAADAIDSRELVLAAGDTVQLVNQNFGPVFYGVGTKKNDITLRQMVNDSLETWEEGWDESRERWFGDVPGEVQRPAVDRY
jgi:glutamate transport system substrate-binding protein